MSNKKIPGLPFENLTEMEKREREKRASELLDIILKIMILMFTVYLISRDITEPEVLLSDIVLYVITASLVVSYVLLRKKKFYIAAILAIGTAFSGMTFIAFTNYGVRDIGVTTYYILIIFSALLLGWRYSVVVAVFSILSLAGMAVYETNGYLVYNVDRVGLLARDMSFFIAATLALTILYERVLNRYIRDINLSRNQYFHVNEELKERNSQIMKINEELVKAKTKAEESDMLKTAFLANLSHEIRTPMNGIIGFSELVLTPGIPDEERKEYNNIISQSCRQLLGVVNDIIDISKIESGIIELNKQPVNLNQLLQEVYSLHHLAARKGDIVLELYTGIEQDNSYILTDDVKLRQVLNNLLGNAIKFTEHGSVKFGYTLNDRMLEFFVSDTGIGIPADDQERIFERFTQEDISNTRKYGGTGLGLSIAKAYVEKLGGKIWVQSRLNQGSRFFFTVPFESIQLKGNNLKKSKPSAQMNKI